MDVGSDSIQNIDNGERNNFTEFILFWNEQERKIERKITFTHSSAGMFSLKDIEIDSEGNIYVASDDRGGNFEVLGQKAPYERHFSEDGVSFSINKNDSLNYFKHYEGYGYERVNMIKTCEDGSVYESGTVGYSFVGEQGVNLYINEDSILINEKNSEFLAKRDESGNLKWVIKSGCNYGYDIIETMDCSHEDFLILGGFKGCHEDIHREGLIRYIDKQTGKIHKEYTLKKESFVFEFAIGYTFVATF